MQEAWVILLISFLSGSTTVIGALLAIFLKRKKNYVSIGVGFSSGIMIVISFLELLATALKMTNELVVILSFAVGFVFVLITYTDSVYCVCLTPNYSGFALHVRSSHRHHAQLGYGFLRRI